MFYFNCPGFHRIYTNIFTYNPNSVERRCTAILRRMCQLTLTRIVFQVSRVFDLNYQVKPQPTFSLPNFLLFYTFGFNDTQTHLCTFCLLIRIPFFHHCNPAAALFPIRLRFRYFIYYTSSPSISVTIHISKSKLVQLIIRILVFNHFVCIKLVFL